MKFYASTMLSPTIELGHKLIGFLNSFIKKDIWRPEET